MQTNAPYQRILASINLLVENSEESQDKIDRPILSSIQKAQEFCTIKVCTARQSGHSLAIAHFLLDRTNEHWALITPTVYMLQNNIEQIYTVNNINGYQHNIITRRTEHQIEFVNGGSITYASINNMDSFLRGSHVNGIIVDCASFLNKRALDNLYITGYASMARNRYKYFIFIE